MDQSHSARESKIDKALALFQQADDRQMSGELDE
jgi:hypothetical protein